MNILCDENFPTSYFSLHQSIRFKDTTVRLKELSVLDCVRLREISLYCIKFFCFFVADGSDARYYLSRQWESTNWVIHLQGGGSCITYEECRLRSEGPLGSSLPLDDQITGEWTLSNDPKINPTFHSWNKVLIPYCRYNRILKIIFYP